MTSIEFLNLFHEGPWNISGGKSPTSHRRCNELDVTDIVAQAQESEQSVWFRCQPAARATGKDGAVQDGDVDTFCCLPVDIDMPSSIVDVTSMSRWQQDVTTMLQSGKVVPVPSLITTSGFGVQAFYLFKECEQLAPAVYAAKVKQLARTLKDASWPADQKIFNPSRLMRLIGTYNFKRKIDGVYPQAKLLHFGEVRYSPSDFADATDTPAAVVSRVSPESDRLTPALRTTALIRYLILHGTEGLSAISEFGDRRELIKQLEEKFKDESAGVQWICSHLQAGGNDDETILETLFAPGTWTERNLSNKDNPRREAERHLSTDTLQRYYPYLRQLRDWNLKYRVVSDFGGGAAVIDVGDGGRSIWSKMKFKEAMSKVKKENWQLIKDSWSIEPPDKKDVPFADYWLEHELTPLYRRVVRTMGKHDPQDLNMHPGWSIEPKQGDWSKIKAHMLQTICAGNEEHYQWLLKWMAKGVQTSGPMGSAIVLAGPQGVGKNCWSEAYGSLWKEKAGIIQDANLVLGNFNATLTRHDCIIFDEALFSGNGRHADTVKSLITGTTILINKKNHQEFSLDNNLRIIIISNHSFVVRAERDSRRFFVLNPAEIRMTPKQYLDIQHQLDTGGRAAMLYDLLNMNISEFNSMSVPQTEGLKEQRLHTELLQMDRYEPLLGKLYGWLEDCRMPRTWMDSDDFINVRPTVLAKYLEHEEHFRISPKAIAVALQKYVGGVATRNNKFNFIKIPKLAIARGEFAKHFPASSTVWEKSDDMWEIGEKIDYNTKGDYDE